MKFVLPIFMCALFASCFDDGDCLISATNYMHIQFRKKSNINLDTLVAIPQISFSGTDTTWIFKNKDTTFSEILLPVDIHHSIDTFVFHRLDSAIAGLFAMDTLVISYATESKLISPACGAFTYFQNLKIVRTSFGAQVKSYSTSLIKDPTSSGIAAYAVNYQILY